MDQSDEPLDPQSWVEAIARLNARVARDPDPMHFARHLRNAYAMSRLAPPVLSEIFAARPAEARYEELLSAADLDQAAMALLNPALRLIPAKPDGTATIEIHAPFHGIVGIATGHYPRAVVLAWTRCVMEFAAQVGEIDAAISRRDQRTPRSEQRPLSTVH